VKKINYLVIYELHAILYKTKKNKWIKIQAFLENEKKIVDEGYEKFIIQLRKEKLKK
jgi:hypothetical protein